MTNGNKIYAINSVPDCLLKVDVFFPAGRIHQSQASVASLCIDMLFEGTKKRSAKQMAEALDFYGAYTDYAVKPEWASVTLYTLNKHLASVLPLFVELLTEPLFDKEELKQLASREIQDLNISLEKNSVLAQRKAAQLLWGETHPWGILIYHRQQFRISSTKTMI